MRLLVMLTAAAISASATGLTVPQLVDISRGAPAAFREALLATFTADQLKGGTAVLGEGPSFVFALETAGAPVLAIDEVLRGSMTKLPGSNVWYQITTLQTGISHKFHYIVDGRIVGGLTDVAAYGPDSYEKPGVPHGKLSRKLIHTSRIYPGMQSDFWVYVPAQYDPKVAAALMVWQDGQSLVQRDGPTRAQIVFDNLTAQKKIPVMIHVFISPGLVGTTKMRSIEYDTVDDTYPRFLRDEILAEVQKEYNIRKDSYSRAIAGNSSGGICAFNAAWQQPDQFSRVLSRIGSFTSIQWHPGKIEGGNVYPFKIRKEAKRNIRVWLQDGSEDLENNHGSWPLQNIELANSLKMQGYDFHLSFGNGTHSPAHGNSELPQELTWLWREYNPSLTSQQYEMETAERSKPMFRVKIYGRE